ncbi:unnamed protein product [Calypogeia fissa]
MQQWLSIDETAKTMLRRLHERRAPSIAPMPPLHRTTLHGRNVLEIAGPPGSGKTELLLQSVVSCILPKEWEGISLGGSEKPVLYLDLDCRFDIRRLVHLLESRIYDAEMRLYDMAWDMYDGQGGKTPHTNDKSGKQRPKGTGIQRTSAAESVEGSSATGSDSSVKTLVKTCLQRFYLKRCCSSFEFLVALKTMRAFMYQVAAQHGTTAELLILDSIGSFYWLERTTRSASAQAGRKTLNLWTVSEAVVNELHRVVQNHPKLLIMATKAMILKSWPNENPSSWKRGHIGRTNSKMQRPGYKKIPEQLFKSDKYSSRSTTEESPIEQSGHHDFLPASWRGFVTHRIVLQGPYQSDAYALQSWHPQTDSETCLPPFLQQNGTNRFQIVQSFSLFKMMVSSWLVEGNT